MTRLAINRIASYGSTRAAGPMCRASLQGAAFRPLATRMQSTQSAADVAGSGKPRSLTSAERAAHLFGPGGAASRGWHVPNAQHDHADRRDAMSKTYLFPDFGACLAWMVRVGVEADKRNHHPEVGVLCFHRPICTCYVYHSYTRSLMDDTQCNAVVQCLQSARSHAHHS